MAPSPESRLLKLSKDARTKGQYPLVVAAEVALREPDHIDHQINVVGALHEVGKLKNSLRPYWKQWREAPGDWIDRCMSRLRSADHDYWALAALHRRGDLVAGRRMRLFHRGHAKNVKRMGAALQARLASRRAAP